MNGGGDATRRIARRFEDKCEAVACTAAMVPAEEQAVFQLLHGMHLALMESVSKGVLGSQREAMCAVAAREFVESRKRFRERTKGGM